MKETEGSKQWQIFKQEENARKRSEIALQMFKDEKEYLRKVSIIVEAFLKPMRTLSMGNYAIVPIEEVSDIFYNLEPIRDAHSKFLKNLEGRVNTWDSEATLGNLFLSLVVDVSKLYEQYMDHHPVTMEKVETYMDVNTHFKTFIVQTESDNKVLFEALLHSPLKRLSNYFLLLEELMQYTSDTHPDKEQLKVVTARLKQQFEQQRSEMQNTISRNNSRRNNVVHKKSVSGSIHYGNRRNSLMSGGLQMRKSSSVYDMPALTTKDLSRPSLKYSLDAHQ